MIIINIDIVLDILLLIMDGIFCNDLVYNLMNYTTVKDIYGLKTAFPTIKLTTKMINKKIISIINAKLEKIFGNELQSFKNLLNDTEACVTGSFIMQCVLDECYNSDIDVFIHQSYLKDIETYLNKSIRMNKNNNYFKFLDSNNHDRLNSSHECNVVGVYNHNIGDNVVQIIFVNTSDSDKIINSFDLDICKNVYSIKNNKECLHIHNIGSLLEKKGNMTYVKDFNRYMKRYHKYANRGYVINRIIPKYMIEKAEDDINKSIDNSHNFCVNVIHEDSQILHISYNNKKLYSSLRYDDKFDNCDIDSSFTNLYFSKCKKDKSTYNCNGDVCEFMLGSRKHIHCRAYIVIVLN